MEDQKDPTGYLNKSHQVFTLLLDSCWVLFYLYLSNEDICKIDSALTEKSLRELYINQVSKFYSVNNIYSVGELEWIMKRGIDLTVCRLDFDCEGKTAIQYHNPQVLLHNYYLESY